jgi:uncharacterized membrane protein YjjP (DUF1212 family)
MTNTPKILDITYEAGAILLENGAEISRVEETMHRIADHFGVEDESFFVLSNGIMMTGKGFARTKFIPIKGASLDKVVAVNQLSREVAEGKWTLEEVGDRLKQIRAMKPKRAWEQIWPRRWAAQLSASFLAVALPTVWLRSSRVLCCGASCFL